MKLHWTIWRLFSSTLRHRHHHRHWLKIWRHQHHRHAWRRHHSCRIQQSLRRRQRRRWRRCVRTCTVSARTTTWTWSSTTSRRRCSSVFSSSPTSWCSWLVWSATFSSASPSGEITRCAQSPTTSLVRASNFIKVDVHVHTCTCTVHVCTCTSPASPLLGACSLYSYVGPYRQINVCRVVWLLKNVSQMYSMYMYTRKRRSLQLSSTAANLKICI